jgi:hypothetical protein
MRLATSTPVFLKIFIQRDILGGDDAGQRRSQAAHRREIHAVGTSMIGLSIAPCASVLSCVWTAPGAVASRFV